MPPATLAHYRLDTRIGHGGMGEVYRAFDTKLNRFVAVKVMRSMEAEDVAVGRFLREARAASALNHPNIVVIHEVGETAEGDHFIVQELIDGSTLRARVSEPMPVSDQVGVLLVELVLESTKCPPAVEGPGQPSLRNLVADPFCEVSHVLEPDVGRKRVDRHQIQFVEVDRILPIDAGVRCPECDLSGLRIDQPLVVIVVLIGQRGRYLVDF